MQRDGFAPELVEAFLPDDIASKHDEGGEDASTFVDIAHAGLGAGGALRREREHGREKDMTTLTGKRNFMIAQRDASS